MLKLSKSSRKSPSGMVCKHSPRIFYGEIPLDGFFCSRPVGQPVDQWTIGPVDTKHTSHFPPNPFIFLTRTSHPLGLSNHNKSGFVAPGVISARQHARLACDQCKGRIFSLTSPRGIRQLRICSAFLWVVLRQRGGWRGSPLLLLHYVCHLAIY